jgi:hypothetical protein
MIGTSTTGNLPIASFSDPLLLLAGRYKLDPTAMVSADDLDYQARLLKQRFFSEVVLAAFSDTATNPGNLEISVTKIAPRLIVNFDIAIIICIICFVLGIAAGGLWYASCPQIRPLGLSSDPNFLSTSALAVQGEGCKKTLEGLDDSTEDQITKSLRSSSVFIDHGQMRMTQSRKSFSVLSIPAKRRQRNIFGRYAWLSRTSKITDKSEKWQPRRLRQKTGVLYGVLLAAILSSLGAFYALSKTTGLYQSAFVYKGNLLLGSHRISLAPYSIVPTLIAVLLKLCWGPIDSIFRRLTPFLEMLKRPQKAQISMVSYLSTPIFWVTILATQRRHWLLAIVTAGALLLEMLQVSMSGLWSRQLGTSIHTMTLKQQYEITTLPHTFVPDIYQSYKADEYQPREAFPAIEKFLYGGSNFENSWLFGGLVQSAFNGTSPPWSKDNWGFPPVDLRNSNSVSGNATYKSPALSGRIECTPIVDANRWITLQNLTNSSMWNITGNPKNLINGYQLSSQVRHAKIPSQPYASKVFIGQWLYYGYEITTPPSTYNYSESQNFTVLWIETGAPLFDYQDGEKYNGNNPVFADRPQTQAINCAPIFETANAEITVNIQDGQVQEYQIIDNPRIATKAFNTAFVPVTAGNGYTINTTVR